MVTNIRRPTTALPKRRRCPECGSEKVLAVIHGIPTAAKARQIESGQAIVADREEWEGMSEWYCSSCGCDWSRHSRRFKKPGGINATQVKS